MSYENWIVKRYIFDDVSIYLFIYFLYYFSEDIYILISLYFKLDIFFNNLNILMGTIKQMPFISSIKSVHLTFFELSVKVSFIFFLILMFWVGDTGCKGISLIKGV